MAKTNDDIHVNKKYRDTVFRKLFGENKGNALSLYNADLYQTRLRRSERLYGKHLLKIPHPHYIVFYNGSEKDMEEERRTLRLSDAFETDTGAGEYEWTATMININSGKNQSVMDSCHVLYEYAVFVAKIKKYRDSMELKEAIDLAVRECIVENILRDFLEQHRREVCDMCLTEFDEKKYEDVLREEGREEGLAEGLEKGRFEERKTLLEIVQKLKEGKTPEQLVADGMEKESVNSAIMLRKLL